MDESAFLERYAELARYVDWTPTDAERAHAIGNLLRPRFPEFVDDFYATIQRSPGTRTIVRPDQIERLKGSLHRWLSELLSGKYDEAYVLGRVRVGRRHVEIGLDQAYTSAAMSRLRTAMTAALLDAASELSFPIAAALITLQKLLDLDLAVIQETYEADYLARQQRVERLAAIGRMGGGIAHELRNPLNVISTSAYFLRHARSLTPEKADDHLQRIERQVHAANEVITALSDIARLPRPEKERVPLGPLIADACQDAGLDERVAVEVAAHDDQDCVWADPRLLKVAVGNLLRNAGEALARTGGQVSIEFPQRPRQRGIRVVDDGPGIAEAHLGQVFEPLYSTKERGLGLGLALVQTIVENHGGAVEVANSRPRGASFTLWLEAAENPARETTVPPTP